MVKKIAFRDYKTEYILATKRYHLVYSAKV